jgi:hypothetical protein
MPTVHRSIRLTLSGELPPPLLVVLRDYRRLVNEVLREALRTGKTARGSMSRFARDRAFVHQFNGQHAVVASDIALSLTNSHRVRLRRGRPSSVPYVRRPFLRTNRETFHFGVESGTIRLSLRSGEWCSFVVAVAPYHREVLARSKVRIQQLQVSERGSSSFSRSPSPSRSNRPRSSRSTRTKVLWMGSRSPLSNPPQPRSRSRRFDSCRVAIPSDGAIFSGERRTTGGSPGSSWGKMVDGSTIGSTRDSTQSPSGSSKSPPEPTRRSPSRI